MATLRPIASSVVVYVERYFSPTGVIVHSLIPKLYFESSQKNKKYNSVLLHMVILDLKNDICSAVKISF